MLQLQRRATTMRGSEKHLTNLCNFRLGIKSFRNSVINIHVKEIR